MEPRPRLTPLVAVALAMIASLAGAVLCEAQAPPQAPSGSRVPPPPPASFAPGQPPIPGPRSGPGGFGVPTPPPAPQRVPIGPVTKLPEPRTKGEVSVEQALAGRHTMMETKPGRITFQEAGQLLWAAQGITGAWNRRAAPSAGGSYPIEALLVAFDVEGLVPGVYRYWSNSGQVERIADGDRHNALAPVVRWKGLDQVPALVVITGFEERSARVFPSPFLAHTRVAMEAGAVTQNVMLEAVALGLGTAEVVPSDVGMFVKLIELPPGETPFAVVVVARE